MYLHNKDVEYNCRNNNDNKNGGKDTKMGENVKMYCQIEEQEIYFGTSLQSKAINYFQCERLLPADVICFVCVICVRALSSYGCVVMLEKLFNVCTLISQHHYIL